MSNTSLLQNSLEEFHNSYWSAIAGLAIGLLIQVISSFIVYYTKTDHIRSDDQRNAEEKKKAIDQFALNRGIKPDFWSIINASMYMPLLIICIMNASRIQSKTANIILIVSMLAFSFPYFIIGKSYFGKWWLAIAQLAIWIAAYFLFVSTI